MQELHHDYEQLPILGHLIWYGLTGIKTDRATLLHLLTQHGSRAMRPSHRPINSPCNERSVRGFGSAAQRSVTLATRMTKAPPAR
ncbi:MAG: hypothetical protein M3R61_08325 [Chloroflexota bacterium]|nr:hypothetical protein [Chloroflexota bacterium]